MLRLKFDTRLSRGHTDNVSVTLCDSVADDIVTSFKPLRLVFKERSVVYGPDIFISTVLEVSPCCNL